tara:strand:- start:1334 stop:1582 length:249 start_codon:yes stop_codon:yes gene_type:complete
MNKTGMGFFTGIMATISGIFLAVSAQSIAFSEVKGYSPPRQDTSYAVQEYVLQQIGLLVLAFGLLLILIVYREYLRAPASGD